MPENTVLPLQRSGKQPERQHEEGKRFDLLDVLDAPDGRPANAVARAATDGTRWMPAAVLEEQEHGCPGKRQKSGSNKDRASRKLGAGPR